VAAAAPAHAEATAGAELVEEELHVDEHLWDGPEDGEDEEAEHWEQHAGARAEPRTES
jgi:hypothetical protein